MEPLRRALAGGDQASACAQAWFEFLCGSNQFGVTESEIELVQGILQDRIVAVDSTTASLGARLFNETGRRKGSQGDCIIAAAAILEDASLFTLNRNDFGRFEPFGLRLLR
jgi:predicted nucleic acid-binding protein